MTRDHVLRELAWRLPRRLVMWAYLRVVAHATMGQHAATVPAELDVLTALRRWNRSE